ncbi:MAG: ABC transporter ATP-binding protein/permease [bacterium]|nr:ABC transporter ATP-binding protein/permease [bacterium]
MSKKSSRERFLLHRQRKAGKGGKPTNAAKASEEKNAKKSRSFGQLMWAFLKLMRPHKGDVIFALTTLTIGTILKLAPPAALKVAIDYLLNDNPLPLQTLNAWNLPHDRVSLLFLLCLAVITAELSATFIHLWGRWRATLAVNRMQVSLRKTAFEHAVRLPLHRVYQLKSGGAASLLREDAGGASDLIFNLIYNPWRAIVQLIGSLVILAMVDWRMLLGGITMIPLVYLTHRTWVNRIRPMFRDIRAQRQIIDGSATEAFGGMRIVRAFNRERAESTRFVGGNNLLVRHQLYAWWWSRIVDVAWSVLIPVATTGALAYGGYQILQGNLTLGDLTLFLFYLAMLLAPLATLATSATTFQNNLAGLDRILDLLDEPTEGSHADETFTLDPVATAGRITFRDVDFTYPAGDSNVLTDINLDVAPGETIALVGKSGAGKTTFCNLVARFYDPTVGSVEIDGRDLTTVELDSFRQLLGVVEQDVFLFDGTIADNIGYAYSRSDRAAVEEAARLANAHEFIAKMEKGYDTLIGERGVRLSGGQRQRLAIARAILADPKILILDEATSNLDSESEQLIQSSLESLLAGRTCFVIAHRMSTISLADRIVILQDGKIVRVGDHAELMSEDNWYRSMVLMQAGGLEVS